MSGDIPERIAWAVGALDVQPDDEILEIGCGLGLAIGPVCDRLTSGHLTAIDRSLKMVDAARESNAAHITSRKAVILHADLLSAILPPERFTKIFLFNINVFWMDPVAELREIARLLAPGARFYLFHQPPPEHDTNEYAAEFRKNLMKNGFVVEEVHVAEIPPSGVVCVISRQG